MTPELAAKEYPNKPFEIIEGKVYFMSPARFEHAIVAGNIFLIFGNFLKGKKCTPIPDGVKVIMKNPKTGKNNSMVPDFMVVCDRSKIRGGNVHGAPDLVAEVFSRSTWMKDRTVKKDAYEAMGVKELWLVSAEAKSIERYLLTDGKYVLENVYGATLPEGEEEDTELDDDGNLMPPPPTKLKVSLYDDLIVDADEVFAY